MQESDVDRALAGRHDPLESLVALPAEFTAMTQLRHEAVDILAYLASRNPEGFRSLMGDAIDVDPGAMDPVGMAEGAAEAVAERLNGSSEARLARRFGDHMRFLGRIERTTRKRCGLVMTALLALGEDLLDAAAEGQHDAQRIWNQWVGARKEQYGQDSSAILSSWKVFREDLRASESCWDFTFVEAEGRLSSLSEAATSMGGSPWGGSDTPGPDIYLHDLPFSAFVGVTDQDDPSVSGAIVSASSLLRTCKAALFRVDWTVGARLGLAPVGYVSALAKAMPRHEIRTVIASGRRQGDDGGRDLYVAAATKWSGEFAAVTVGPVSVGLYDGVPARVLRGLLRTVELG